MKKLRNQQKNKLNSKVYFNQDTSRLVILARRINIYSSSLLRTINVSLIFFFILLLPTQLGKHFFFDFSYLSGVRVDYLSPTIYLTDIFVFALTILNLRYLFSCVMNKKIIIIFTLFIITIIIAQNKYISFYRAIKLLELLSIYFIFSKERVTSKIMIPAFLIGGLFESILTIIQFINKHSVQGVFYFFGERPLSLSMPGIAKAALDGIEFLRPYGTFSHPNSLAGFYLLIYFFIITSADDFLAKKSYFFKFLKSTLLFICSVLILISFSKLTIGVFVFLNVIYLWTNRKNFSCKFCLISRILILTIVSLVFLKAQTDPLTLEKRYLLFNNALEILRNNVLFGVGLGNYLVAQSRLYTKYFDLLNQPVHNILLLFLAEVGVITTFILGIALSKPLKYLLSKAPFLVAVILLTGLFDHYWLTLQQNFLLVGVVFGVRLKDQD